MTPTSSTPEPLPPDVAVLLDAQPPPERAALTGAWHLAGALEAPPPHPDRKAAVWSQIEQQIAVPPRAASRLPADRGPVQRAGRGSLRPLVATTAVLVAAAVLAWAALVGSQNQPQGRSYSGAPHQISPFRLPDGSVVRLGPGAVLRPLGNWPEERAYTLTGTAEFEVERDPRRPFRIETAQMEITVLGTRFTVHADRPDEGRVAVQSGRVAVRQGTERAELGPSQQVVAGAASGLVVRLLPSAPEAVFAFDDAPLPDVLREVEVLFDTRITYPEALADRRITITRHGPLEVQEILQSICASLRLRYRATAEGFVVYAAP